MVAEPLAIAEGFAAAWNTADADALAALFTADADFVNVVGLWWTDRRQIRNNHAYGFRRMFPNTTISFNRLKVRMLGNDVAVIHASWTMSGQIAPDGQPAGTRRGVISFTTALQSTGQWLAVSAQNTDAAPGMQTHLATQEGLEPETYANRRS